VLDLTELLREKLYQMINNSEGQYAKATTIRLRDQQVRDDDHNIFVAMTSILDQ
jgi:hypothetical protein